MKDDEEFEGKEWNQREERVREEAAKFEKNRRRTPRKILFSQLIPINLFEM